MKKMYYLILIVLFPSCTITKPLLLSYKDYTVEKELSSDKKKMFSRGEIHICKSVEPPCLSSQVVTGGDWLRAAAGQVIPGRRTIRGNPWRGC